MSRSIFGWSYPPGVTHLPGEDEPDQCGINRCSKCGRFMKLNADRVEPIETKYHCDGKATEYQLANGESSYMDPQCGNHKNHEPHEYVESYASNHIFICSCGFENKVVA